MKQLILLLALCFLATHTKAQNDNPVIDTIRDNERIAKIAKMYQRSTDARLRCDNLLAAAIEDSSKWISQTIYKIPPRERPTCGSMMPYEHEKKLIERLKVEEIYADKCGNYDTVLKYAMTRNLIFFKYPLMGFSADIDDLFLILKKALQHKYKNTKKLAKSIKVDSIQTKPTARFYCHLLHQPFEVCFGDDSHNPLEHCSTKRDTILAAEKIIKQSFLYKILSEEIVAIPVPRNFYYTTKKDSIIYIISYNYDGLNLSIRNGEKIFDATDYNLNNKAVNELTYNYKNNYPDLIDIYQVTVKESKPIPFEKQPIEFTKGLTTFSDKYNKLNNKKLDLFFEKIIERYLKVLKEEKLYPN